jgi:hypothetical protein
LSLGVALVAAPAPRQLPPTPPPAPFPSAAVLVERRQAAENLPLFQSAEPLVFTLAADFKAIDRDRHPESTTTYPGTITFGQSDGTTVTRPVRVRGRGHTRRDPRVCDFVPLRIEFAKPDVAGTVFAGQSALKLGTHCRSAALFEQYVLREYTAYRIFNLLTPASFRVRLARATYVDAPSKKSLGERFAIFLEDADDVARRMEGRVNEQRKFGFDRLDQDYLTLMTLFQFMIGNTDLAVKAQHNIRAVEMPDETRYAVPYDFDYSGLVNTIYAVVDTKRIEGITSVRERRYLGPCRTQADLEPFLEKMRAARPAVEALYDLPGFTEASRRDGRAYLESFYRTIDRPAEVKKTLVDRCMKDG